jgi:hypothetical protein
VLERLLDPHLTPVIAVGLLVLLTVGVFAQHLFGHWTFPWDFEGAYSTSPAFVAATIGSGHPIWWLPFAASGFPVDVDPQAGVFYPVWWIFGVLGVPLNLTAVVDVQVAHVFFGAVGVLALARARRLGWPWATAAAVGYLFFGGFYGNAEHADIFRGFAYLPWLLWALTPPAPKRRWTRLLTVPPLAWLIASGAYPGQLVSFAVIALVYLIVALALSPREVWRRYRIVLALATVASVGIALAVLEPYLLATHHNDLIRIDQPTAAWRATGSFGPVDVLSLWLNPFAFHHDATILSWGMALPLLMGLVYSTRTTVRRQAPLVASGVVALLLATTPKIGFVGHAMVSLGTLFPSRYPASDYKAGIAIALLISSAEAWAHIASTRKLRLWPVLILGCALALGTVLASSAHASATRTLWLALLVITATIALIVRRPRRELLIVALIGLIAVDGIRDARDSRAFGTVSTWQLSPKEVVKFRDDERYVPRLNTVLRRAPVSRPARVPPATPLSVAPRGNIPDAAGWVADGYHFNDYTGPLERTLWEVEQSLAWTRLMLAPWHAYVFPCAHPGCTGGSGGLPPPGTWRPSPSVRTLSYGAGRIVYEVHLSRPAVMVENELAIRGWDANTPRAQVIDAHLPLRTWRLSAGTYRFTASYHESGRGTEIAAAVVALLAWLGSIVLVGRRRAAPRVAL